MDGSRVVTSNERRRPWNVPERYQTVQKFHKNPKLKTKDVTFKDVIRKPAPSNHLAASLFVGQKWPESPQRWYLYFWPKKNLLPHLPDQQPQPICPEVPPVHLFKENGKSSKAFLLPLTSILMCFLTMLKPISFIRSRSHLSAVNIWDWKISFLLFCLIEEKKTKE